MINTIRTVRHEMIVPAESLFRSWIGVASILKAFCDGTDGWVVDNDGCHLIVRPKYPPYAFPLEHVPMMNRILDKLGSDYLPDLSKFMMNKINDEIKYAVLCEIRRKEHEIVSVGGRSFKDEMRFRLGVYYV